MNLAGLDRISPLNEALHLHSSHYIYFVANAWVCMGEVISEIDFLVQELRSERLLPGSWNIKTIADIRQSRSGITGPLRVVSVQSASHATELIGMLAALMAQS